jgi:hypothetical protein
MSIFRRTTVAFGIVVAGFQTARLNNRRQNIIRVTVSRRPPVLQVALWNDCAFI